MKAIKYTTTVIGWLLMPFLSVTPIFTYALVYYPYTTLLYRIHNDFNKEYPISIKVRTWHGDRKQPTERLNDYQTFSYYAKAYWGFKFGIWTTIHFLWWLSQLFIGAVVGYFIYYGIYWLIFVHHAH